MSHLSDDELVLHYYGEDGPQIVAVERHLNSCAQCARAYEMLDGTLTAVTPPEFVEALDDLPALRRMIRERTRSQAPPRGLVALVWLVPLLYPLSFRALFGSGRLAHEQVFGVPLVALTLVWTCAGPFVSVFALNRMTSDAFDRISTRLLVFGAMVAAATPALYLVLSRLRPGLQWWYWAVTAAALVALVRWPATPRSTTRFLYVHRLSALVITVFALIHIGNQAVGFVSTSSYAATLSVLRVGYHEPVMQWLLLVSAGFQIVTGAAMGMTKVRAGAWRDNLQAVSGWYLAVFLMTHVFLGLILNARRAPLPPAALAAAQLNLLASARGAAQLPFLLLGVVAFLYHVGAYARLVALAYLAEASVRRLSYAAMFVATTVVLTVGLALCGVHLIP